MNTSEALQELGLSSTESAVYLFLLRNGTTSGPQLQAALALEKVPIYRALGNLKSKDYVTSIGETRNQKFAAQPLTKLLERYDERMQELTNARAGLETFMRTVAEQQQELYKQNKIQIFEGKDGYRLWNEERLRKDVTIIREGGSDAFVSSFFAPDELGDYMRGYIKRRAKKGIAIRILHDSSEQLRDWDQSSTAILKETRSLPMPSGLPVYISTFGTRFGFYTEQEGKYLGVIIDDPMLTTLMDWFFDNLWENGSKV